MQLKSIKKIITNKLENWLDSIEDVQLRSDVRNNILLSGGSIASLLQGVDVNDYDIYIKDMNVLYRLAEYYTKNFPIEILDGRKKDEYQEYLDERAPMFNRIEYDVEEGVADEDLAKYSVALRTLRPDQIKLYMYETGGHKVYWENREDLPKYRPLFFSPNAISLSDDIQIVVRFHGDNEAIHKTFDFIHATNYFTFKDGLVTNTAALESLLTKQLKYQGSLYPLTSIIRIKKFINRGWKISAGEMLKIMFQISELNLKDPDVLEEQLIGVDIAYFGTLVDILRGVDPNKYTSEHLNSIIDKVFDDDETMD
jgi:hypothetical protein